MVVRGRIGREDGVFIGRMRNGELGMMQPLRLGKKCIFFPVLLMRNYSEALAGADNVRGRQGFLLRTQTQTPHGPHPADRSFAMDAMGKSRSNPSSAHPAVGAPSHPPEIF
jgi:hypothetical protein